ncbi:TMV resistance protein N, partial [Mucuna pruriens]
MPNGYAPMLSDFTYDVFLSSSDGVSNAFVDSLCRVLRGKGINIFRSEDGKTRPAIEEIENSKMVMVVLCNNYAFSTESLDELAKIREYVDNKRKQVWAFFYKVEPSDVRKQRNSYEAAMKIHEEKYGEDAEKVQAWREALTRVCDLSGVHFKDDVFEAELKKIDEAVLDKIVEAELEKIIEAASSKLVPVPVQMNHVVGLDHHFEMVKSFIDVESSDSIRMLGIYGAGGIGKTTFAAYIYEKIRHYYFEASCFLIKVRENPNKSKNLLEGLQKTLLSEMGVETETMMGSTNKGEVEIKRRLGHRRVVIVLDDVDSKEQLELLVGKHNWFGSGSRIIITTRDAAVLDYNAGIKKYKMEELNDSDSLKLFCWNAFDMPTPAKNFENISHRAIDYAKGIPLALRVIGSNLKGKSIEGWEIELGKYRKVLNAEIQDVLEISYYSLLEPERKIFLDIACFFKGEKVDYVKRILKASDLSCQVLASKCLIMVDENDCLEMHDLIQDMGREIVRGRPPLNPGHRSRLWSHEDILQVLKENLGSSKIEGIMLHPPKLEEVDNWNNAAFEKMKNLRILIVRNTKFPTGPSYLPNNLRLLDWIGFPSESFPPNFYPENIVDFKLSYSPLVSIKPLQKVFQDLTFVNLSQCQFITQIPNMYEAKNLRVLTIDRCHKLEGFHQSIGRMPNLVYLSASECTMLRSFVPRMYLPSLQMLSFNFCSKLEEFPEVLGKMDEPLKIHMINTAVQKFPESICKLTGLEYVDMSTCSRLQDLSSFVSLPKLVTLKMNGCSQLAESFKMFRNSYSQANSYPSLKALSLSKANLSYEDLSIILEIFPKLEYLNVSHNEFESLPECIKQSLQLKHLDVSFCRNLREIPELPLSIQTVDARYCQSLTTKASNVLLSEKTNTHDIRFISPNSTSLVSKTSPHKETRHEQKYDVIENFGEILNSFKLEQTAGVANALLRWWRNAKADIRGEVSASTYEASSLQEHEDVVWDVAQILDMLMENLPKHITDSEVQRIGQLVVELLVAHAQHMKEYSHEKLHINLTMPIILVECEGHSCRGLEGAQSLRYWGTVELEEGDPLVWKIWKSNEALRLSYTLVLKCEHHSAEESLEKEYNDPALQALMRSIEEDATRLNKSYGKLKASIVPMDVQVSDKYLMETAIIRGLERLGRLLSNFNKTDYGKLRVEHEAHITTCERKK